MDVTETQQLPGTTVGGTHEEANPDSTSTLPAVEPPHRSRLHRATNLLALGQHHEAAELCREELEEYPDSLDAYALLAMAEEQAGHRAFAIDLLEELLRLDPTRTAEAEHLAELRREQEELEAEQPSPEEREEQIRRLQPVALLVLAGATVCLLCSLALLVIVRHRAAVAQARYATAMQYGDQYYRAGNYPEAMGWYAQALNVAPKDATARNRYALAVQASQMSGSWEPASPVTINPAANPFPPVPIGPQPQPPTGATPGPGAFPSPAQPYAPPPSVRGSDRGGTPSGPDWEQREPIPGPTTPGLIEPPPPPPTASTQPAATQPAGTSPGNAATGSTPSGSALPPSDPGQIKIERVDRPVSQPSAQQKGDNLRAEGQRLYGEGQYGAAARSFRAAIAAYEAAKADHPEQRRSLDSAIQSLQAQINLCEKHSQ